MQENKIIKPVILKEGKYSKSKLDSLRRKSAKVVDIYSSQLRELFEVQNPNGTGDRVSDNVEFTPWLSSAPFSTWPCLGLSFGGPSLP